MRKKMFFETKKGSLSLPVFFPDATKAVIKTLDSEDIKNTKTPGILVNTYHLFRELGEDVLEKYGGIGEFMSWQGGIISDSGGFQVMTLAKSGSPKGKVTDQGVVFRSPQNKPILFTPEKSIRFQMKLAPDMLIVLDDFTNPKSSYQQAKETVRRTIVWAKKSKAEFEKICAKRQISEKKRPYLLAVVQGGEYLDLRKECTERLVEIGFDGYGFGGWPLTSKGKFNYPVAKEIADCAPRKSFLYGLGIGKPEEIVNCVDLGYTIFDCVLPTRDARHGRLYVYKADSIEKVEVKKPKFYSYYLPTKQKYSKDDSPVSTACDCLLCTKVSRAYLYHLFKIGDLSAKRLATIHNLRFYSLLMEKLQKK